MKADIFFIILAVVCALLFQIPLWAVLLIAAFRYVFAIASFLLVGAACIIGGIVLLILAIFS